MAKERCLRVSHLTNNTSQLDNLPGDSLRLFEVSQPHLRNMLRQGGVNWQDYDDLIQETYVGFLHFLQKPDKEVDSSVTLLPVLIDIMKKRICDYRSRKRWKAQSLGGTDAQKKMAAILEPRQRDSVAEAKSAWERHPNLEDQVILNLRSKMEAKAFCILNRRRTGNPPTLQTLANELQLSVGKVHKLEALGKEMFQAEFEKLLGSAINKAR